MRLAHPGVAHPPLFHLFPHGDAFLPGSRSHGSHGVPQSAIRQVLREPSLDMVRRVCSHGHRQPLNLAQERKLAQSNTPLPIPNFPPPLPLPLTYHILCGIIFIFNVPPHSFELSPKMPGWAFRNPLILNNLRTPENGISATRSAQKTCALFEKHGGVPYCFPNRNSFVRGG